ERVGGAVQERPVFADERLPRALVARRAQPCELDIAIRGASPLGRPCTLSRAPLRRRALFAWLTRVARSRLHVLAATSSLPHPFPPGRFRPDRSVPSHLHPPRGFAPRTPLHALSLAASPARSDRVARSRALARVPTRSSLPQALPPGGFRTDCSVHSHLLTDVGDVPAGQRGQLLRLAGMALDERPPIVAGGAAGGASGVGMPQHVTSLEIAPIAGLLKDQVIRKV